MAFTAQDVKNLRETTGVGMMDCKKALTEADGDFDKAVELLREKGLAAAAKKAGRIAAEGLVCAKVEGNIGAVIEVNSETDFVAKNADFVSFVEACADTVITQNPADLDALMAAQLSGASVTVEEALREKILTIGENQKLRRFTRFEGTLETYIHGGGRIGVMVRFETDLAGKPEFIAYAKDVAMQIAAINPTYLTRDEVPAEVVEKEKEILLAQIQQDEKSKNKPAQVIEKMIEGRIHKFYKENCLLEQTFVKNNDQDILQYTGETAKALGGSIKVAEFVRYEVGEGLEKRNDNFADEVAGMIQ